jgi:hypothetical protein
MREQALVQPSMHPVGSEAPRPSLGAAVGMEVLSDCLEVHVFPC